MMKKRKYAYMSPSETYNLRQFDRRQLGLARFTAFRCVKLGIVAQAWSQGSKRGTLKCQIVSKISRCQKAVGKFKENVFRALFLILRSNPVLVLL